MLCNARVGDWFEVRGEVLHFPPGQGFSMYSLAAIIPLLPAKQRQLPPGDWLERDDLAPDTDCVAPVAHGNTIASTFPGTSRAAKLSHTARHTSTLHNTPRKNISATGIVLLAMAIFR